MLPQLVASFDHAVAFIEDQVADLSDEELRLQPPGAPNHAAWTVGHVVHSCQEIAGEIGVERWLPGDWEARFGYGSMPAPDGSTAVSKAALLAALHDARDRLRVALGALDARALAAPLPHDEARHLFPTLGHALLQVVVAHTAFHAGQLAAWRRAIGRAPVGVFA